jgi:hypothetical protein
MARTSSSRFLTITPYSTITDFLVQYTSTGVALASLYNLAGIFRSSSIEYLGNLTPNISERAERAAVDSDYPDHAFQVVFFKNVKRLIPPGITSNSIVNFITRQFIFEDFASRDEFSANMTKLIAFPSYNVILITVLAFDTDTKAMTHHIVGATVYMHDKHGSFIFMLCTEDQGNPNVCNLSEKYFFDPGLDEGDEPFLSPTTSFRHNGLATFMLSLVQVLAKIGYKLPPVNQPPLAQPESFIIHCHEPSETTNHHLYLQARIEVGLAYVA